MENKDNLRTIEKLNDNEFLSFLYAERNRVRSMEAIAGWTLWAIVGSVFALIIFVYNQLKCVNGNVDLVLCYNIFCAFFPWCMYIIFVKERNAALGIGDSQHLMRVGDSKSKWILSMLLVMSFLMIVLGLILRIDGIIIFWWLLILILVIIGIVILYNNRQHYVSSFNQFVISDDGFINNLVLAIISGVLAFPFSASLNHLSFGFSVECEITIAIILVIVLLYLLVRNTHIYNQGDQIDNILSHYLFHRCDKLKVIRELESLYIGLRPSDELLEQYNILSNFMKEIPNVEEKVRKIASIVDKGVCSLGSDCDNYLHEMEDCIKFIQNYSILYKQFSDKASSIMKVVSIQKDAEFIAMLENVLDNKRMASSYERLTHINECVNNVIESIRNSINQCSSRIDDVNG